MTKNYKTGHECERCDGESIIGEGATKLVGVYEARLCVRCRNEWEMFIRPHDLWKAKRKLEAHGIMLGSMTQMDGQDRTEELHQADIEGDAVLIKLFNVAAEWMKDV